MKALQKGAGVLQEVNGVSLHLSGVSEGTGSDQSITHGFGTTWTHLKITYGPLESGVTFSSYLFDDVDGRDHFHVTVSSGKSWYWIAESW